MYSNSEIDYQHYTIRMIFLIIIFLYLYVLIYLFWKYVNTLYYFNLYFSILGVLIMLYLIICDERVLSGITQTDYNAASQTHILVMACFIVLLRMVSFENFMLVSSISFFSSILLLSLYLGLSSISPYALLSDFFVYLIFCVLQTIECNQSEYRAKQLF